MPASSVGLLRFFEEETQGIRLPPEVVVALAVVLTLSCVIARLYSTGSLPFF